MAARALKKLEDSLKTVEEKNEEKNLKRGFNLTELVMVIGIVGILTTFTTIRYQKAKEINDIKMLETRIITTINNASISLTTLRDFEPKYMKFYRGGIVIAKGYNSPTNTYEIEYESGLNRGGLEKAGMSMTLDCDDSKGIPCPVLIFDKDKNGNNEDDKVYKIEDIIMRPKDITKYPVQGGNQLTKGIPQNLDRKSDNTNTVYETNRKAARFVKISNGKIERPFSIIVFDRVGNVKSKIKFSQESFLDIKIYNYQGSPISKTNLSLSNYNISGDWTERNIKQVKE